MCGPNGGKVFRNLVIGVAYYFPREPPSPYLHMVRTLADVAGSSLPIARLYCSSVPGHVCFLIVLSIPFFFIIHDMVLRVVNQPGPNQTDENVKRLLRILPNDEGSGGSSLQQDNHCPVLFYFAAVKE